MTAKEYLRRLYWADKRIESLYAELRDLSYKATRTTHVLSPDKAPTAPPRDKQGDLIAAFVDLETDVRAEIGKYVRLPHEIRAKIDGVPNELYRHILRERYVNFKKWEAVAAELHYGRQWLTKLHRRALRAFGSQPSADL
jgi:hypothetical protein